MSRLDSPGLRHMAALSFYLAVAILMTWPVAAHFRERVAGELADNRLFVWTIWVVRQEMMAGHAPLYTTFIYYPEGISLALHALVITKTIPGALLQAMLSPVATYNLLLLISMALTGYATWLLVRHLTQDDSAAIVGGLVFACSP